MRRSRLSRPIILKGIPISLKAIFLTKKVLAAKRDNPDKVIPIGVNLKSESKANLKIRPLLS